MSQFLITSLILSVGLTVVLNLGLWLAGRRTRPEGQEPFTNFPPVSEKRQDSRLQVYAPWKAMVIASIGLTVLLNVIAALTR